MPDPEMVTVDGNEAAVSVAYRLSEIIAVYPITPSSAMGEWADQWASEGRPNLWGAVPSVVEMQSEVGAAGALHGALTTGSQATTFTSSQGLLLMIPVMFKVAGELLPVVLHVAARTVATHALSIFGDHSDVMAVRGTGFALLASASVQEAQDLAAVAHAASLASRVPFLHFFDGFVTSHEVAKIRPLSDEDLKALVDKRLLRAHLRRGLTPEAPVLRGSAQNPDVFFQAREASNPYHLACPGLVQEAMDRLAARTGRAYHLFDYAGAPDAERVIVLMGSGTETAGETAAWLTARGEKVGVLKVRLFRPFSGPDLVAALPATARRLAVLDRTKEPGALGEPLYQDVVTALAEARASGASPFKEEPRVVGGRYGLSSKAFTPAMAKGVFDMLAKARLPAHFTVGILDDVTRLSLDYDPAFSIEDAGTTRALFYGLGSDGTVSAVKATAKILNQETAGFAQAAFVYDSKKSGTVTVSHLRFSPAPIRAPYLIERATFVSCSRWDFLNQHDMLAKAEPGGVFLLNSPHPAAEVWDRLPREVQEQLIAKRLSLHVIDAEAVAREGAARGHINTVMQACFFALSGTLPAEQAIAAMKRAIRKAYGAKGEEVVRRNLAAVDRALAALATVEIPAKATGNPRPAAMSSAAPPYVREVAAAILGGRGDTLPVSAFVPDGTFPTGTSRWEKRNIAPEIPVWDPDLCAECGKCVMVCPHAAIRAKAYDPALLAKAPATFKSRSFRGRDFKGMALTYQVAPEDCTGCALCVEACPAASKDVPGHKALDMMPQPPLRDAERENLDFFLDLPEPDRTLVQREAVKGVQFLEPRFEFSGACTGCGETPYLRLLSQLVGDRLLIANATGCSSIYGGNLPTTPWTRGADGRGPAWSNSLFENNAEFALGFRLSADQRLARARALLEGLPGVDAALATGLRDAALATEADLKVQRERVDRLRQALAPIKSPAARELLDLADAFVPRSVWAVGGDGWAYDIGFGGLDHVLASGRKVNVLVLDTESYSNTGGQASKATPRGAVAKFAAKGKATAKKDLALYAMTYGTVYVAQVALGANDAQAVKAFLEADAFEGPSLVLAYSPCIAHGIEMRTGLAAQKSAVQSGHWPLLRFDPRRTARGENPLVLDSPAPAIPLKEHTRKQLRFQGLARSWPEEAERLLALAQRDVAFRWRLYQHLAALREPAAGTTA